MMLRLLHQPVPEIRHTFESSREGICHDSLINNVHETMAPQGEPEPGGFCPADVQDCYKVTQSEPARLMANSPSRTSRFCRFLSMRHGGRSAFYVAVADRLEGLGSAASFSEIHAPGRRLQYAVRTSYRSSGIWISSCSKSLSQVLR